MSARVMELLLLDHDNMPYSLFIPYPFPSGLVPRVRVHRDGGVRPVRLRDAAVWDEQQGEGHAHVPTVLGRAHLHCQW